MTAYDRNLSTNERQWTPDQLEFMLWLAMPEYQRKPRMQRAQAVKLGLSEPTLSNWKRLPGFSDAVIALTREFVKSSELAQILYAQVRKAKKGDTQAARFVFEAVGEIGKDVANVIIDNREQTITVIYANSDSQAD